LAEKMDFITYLRFFGVFGKYEDYETRFISNAICKKVLGLPITIKKNVLFDYIYVKDLVNILDKFIQNKPPEKFYNVGRGAPIDLLTLANIINDAEGEKNEIMVMAEGLNNEYSCDNTRMMNFAGEYKFYSFPDAIRELFEYYKNIKGSMDINKFLSDI
jgi:UDP-glucose 4-epimerase